MNLKYNGIFLKIGINAYSIHISVFLCKAQVFMPVKHQTYSH